MTTTTNVLRPALVVGGTGKTGRRVAERLTAQGRPTRVGSRAATPPFDWDDDATWAPAVHGVGSAYISYYPDLAFPGAAERVAAFSDLAVANGVERLVLLSGRNEEGALAGELAVQEAGAEWTIVRSSFFNQNFDESFWLEPVLSGRLVLPAGDVAEPFIDAGDVADVAVAALTEDGHAGRVYEVTGPRLLTFADAAGEIAQATGRDLTYIPVSPADYATALSDEGLPEDYISELVELFRTVLDGRSAYLSDGVQQALGRQPLDFADYARRAAATGAWTSTDQHVA